jgi:transposase
MRFTRPTVKLLVQHLKGAYDAGALRSVRRISALLGLAQGESVKQVAETISVSRQTVHNWLKDFLLRGIESAAYGRPTGRKPKLTKTQKNRLVELVKAGPLAAGYLSQCWTSVLIQQLFVREFGVLYNRHYVCELLHNLEFSYRKDKFASDHLDEERRHKWLTETWPQILQQANEKKAMILFQDEVSFAQWGSLSYTWAPVGQQPVVKTCGKREEYKVFGAIDFFSGRFCAIVLLERHRLETHDVAASEVCAPSARPPVCPESSATTTRTTPAAALGGIQSLRRLRRSCEA